MHKALSRNLRSLWRAYEWQLRRRPIATQAATSAITWAAGDYLAQRIEKNKKTDFSRTALTAGFAAAVVGPSGHYWYHGLDIWCRRYFTPGSLAFIAAKTGIDTAVLGPFYVIAFFAFGNFFIDRAGWSALAHKMETDFWPTLAAEVAVWPIFQAFSFAKIPVKHQLLSVNIFTIADAAFMSWARHSDNWYEHMLQGCFPPSLPPLAAAEPPPAPKVEAAAAPAPVQRARPQQQRGAPAPVCPRTI